MHIEHLAIWCEDLEKERLFYEKYFAFKATDKYVNPKKGFSSYFLTSADNACRLELMHKEVIDTRLRAELLGLAHFAIALGSKERVDTLTATLKNDGYEIKGEPRTTGDGYYESVVLDPEGNLLELTV